MQPPTIAGLGGRCYAFLVDWHIRVLLALGWLLAAVFVTGSAAPTLQALAEALPPLAPTLALLAPSPAPGPAPGEWTLTLGPALAIYLLYHPLLETATGNTPGKRAARVRIVAADGTTPTLRALLVRNLLRCVDALPGVYLVGLAVALLTDRSVRVGDLVAGTMLVYERAQD